MASQIPIIGRLIGGKERSPAMSEITSNIQSTNQHAAKDSVAAIWAIGKTDFSVVRAKIEQQFPQMSKEEVDAMIKQVKAIRKGKTQKA